MMWAWLNPANLWKLVSLVKALWSAATSFYEMWREWRREKTQSKAQEKLEADVEASKPRDEETRKNEKDWLDS